MVPFAGIHVDDAQFLDVRVVEVEGGGELELDLGRLVGGVAPEEIEIEDRRLAHQRAAIFPEHSFFWTSSP